MSKINTDDFSKKCWDQVDKFRMDMIKYQESCLAMLSCGAHNWDKIDIWWGPYNTDAFVYECINCHASIITNEPIGQVSEHDIDTLILKQAIAKIPKGNNEHHEA